MSKADKQGIPSNGVRYDPTKAKAEALRPPGVEMVTPGGVAALAADPALSSGAPGVVLAAAQTLIRLRREDYLRVAVEEVTLLDGKEISRRVLHAPDSPGVALGKAYEALERMVET